MNDPITITDSAFFDPLRDAGAATGLESLRLRPCEPDGTGVGAACRPASGSESRNERIKELVREYGHACRINATYGARQEAWMAFVNELERVWIQAASDEKAVPGDSTNAPPHDLNLLHQALEVLEHHREQARLIDWTNAAIAAIRARLGIT